MNPLFPTLNHQETLQQIQDGLSQGASPARIIDEFLPRTRQSAFTWGRSLALWEEFRLGYPPQVVALARLVSQQAMKAYGLTLRKDGRVVEQQAAAKKWKTPKPAAIFTLAIGGEEVRVEYTPQYFPNDDTGLVYFVSPHDPAQAHTLSDTGYFSRFVPHDVVEACGGPQAYAARLADAVQRGEEPAFIEAFEGPAARNRSPLPPARESACGETAADITGRIKDLRAEHTVEAAPEREVRSVTAEVPVTARILHRAEKPTAMVEGVEVAAKNPVIGRRG